LFRGDFLQLDEMYMHEALHIAKYAEGRTSPNPLVGAVIVKNNRIIGAGWHRQAGTEHAEIHALKMAGNLARGATLYVNLEPCSHYGHTGPCAKAVAEAGISRVVIAMEDPNPLVAGKGIALLKQAGIEVVCGVLQDEAKKLNEVFFKWITKNQPFVIMKMAISLDGKLATVTGESQWITNESARFAGHKLRDQVDSILVGINTVLADNPSLTTRLPDGSGKNPVRIILDSQARIPLESKILHDKAAPIIIAVSQLASVNRVEALKKIGADIIIAGEGETVDIKLLCQSLAARNICSILVEGGSTVNFAFLESKMVDKVVAYIAPKLLGGKNALSCVGGTGFEKLADIVELYDIETELLGDNICISGYVRK